MADHLAPPPVLLVIRAVLQSIQLHSRGIGGDKHKVQH